jgi:hypothetical protein
VSRRTPDTADAAVTPGYSIIIPEDTLARAADYLEALRAGRAQAGASSMIASRVRTFGR